VELPRQAVADLLREKLRSRLGRRGYRAFDRAIGRPESGWTTKFLRGHRDVASLDLLLAVLGALEIHPAEFFAEAFPQKPDSKETAVREYFGEFEKQMKEIAERVVEERLKRLSRG
jgi:hypothetical protein